jgi:isopenicillin N synthase-like dioxygenase
MGGAAALLAVDCMGPGARERFCRSISDTGFVVLHGHGISRALIEDTYAAWRGFFASPSKLDFRYNSDTQDGYFPAALEAARGYPAKDLKEFFHFHPWGHHPGAVRAATARLHDELLALSVTLLGWLEEAAPPPVRAGFSAPLAGMIADSPDTVLRVLHYPPLTLDEPPLAMRAAPHEDINLITLLPAATEPGLEVRDASGSFHAVRCDVDGIVVNTGDILELCSRGYYRSTTHRVVNPSGEDARRARMAIALFVHPHPSVQISETHTAGSYLRQRLREIGVLSTEA